MSINSNTSLAFEGSEDAGPVSSIRKVGLVSTERRVSRIPPQDLVDSIDQAHDVLEFYEAIVQTRKALLERVLALGIPLKTMEKRLYGRLDPQITCIWEQRIDQQREYIRALREKR